jgi:Tol biopolymer transport system component
VRHALTRRRAAYIASAAAALATLAACQDNTNPAAPERSQAPAPKLDVAGAPTSADIVFSRKDLQGKWQLFSMAPDGSGLKQLTTGSTDHRDPARSPDYSKIAYVETPAGALNSHLVVMNADGSNPQVVTGFMAKLTHPSFSADGLMLAYSAAPWTASGPAPNAQIFTVSAQPGGVPKRITQDSNENLRPMWRGSWFVSYLGGPATERGVYDVAASASSAPVRYTSGSDISDFTLSKDGNKMALVFYNKRYIQMFDYVAHTGNVIYQTQLSTATVSQLSFSEDGKQLAFISSYYGFDNVARIPSAGGAVTALTSDVVPDAGPAWGR